MNDFIELKPRKIKSNSSLNGIRISFPYRRKNNKEIIGNNLIIYLEKDLIENLELKKGDKIAISYEKENNRIIKLNKSKDNIGFSLTSIRSKSTPYKISLTWDLFKPNENEISVHHVEFEIIKESVLIYLS